LAQRGKVKAWFVEPITEDEDGWTEGSALAGFTVGPRQGTLEGDELDEQADGSVDGLTVGLRLRTLDGDTLDEQTEGSAVVSITVGSRLGTLDGDALDEQTDGRTVDSFTVGSRLGTLDEARVEQTDGRRVVSFRVGSRLGTLIDGDALGKRTDGSRVVNFTVGFALGTLDGDALYASRVVGVTEGTTPDGVGAGGNGVVWDGITVGDLLSTVFRHWE